MIHGTAIFTYIYLHLPLKSAIRVGIYMHAWIPWIVKMLEGKEDQTWVVFQIDVFHIVFTPLKIVERIQFDKTCSKWLFQPPN